MFEVYDTKAIYEESGTRILAIFFAQTVSLRPLMQSNKGYTILPAVKNWIDEVMEGSTKFQTYTPNTIPFWLCFVFCFGITISYPERNYIRAAG